MSNSRRPPVRLPDCSHRPARCPFSLMWQDSVIPARGGAAAVGLGRLGGMKDWEGRGARLTPEKPSEDAKGSLPPGVFGRALGLRRLPVPGLSLGVGESR